MESIQLNIPNMKSPHCQLTVTGIVEAAGAKVRQVGPAKAEIELSDGISREAVIAAIEKGGYKVEQQRSCCAA